MIPPVRRDVIDLPDEPMAEPVFRSRRGALRGKNGACVIVDETGLDVWARQLAVGRRKADLLPKLAPAVPVAAQKDLRGRGFWAGYAAGFASGVAGAGLVVGVAFLVGFGLGAVIAS